MTARALQIPLFVDERLDARSSEAPRRRREAAAGCMWAAPTIPRIGVRLELELVDATLHARRYYALAVAEAPQLPLFGEERGVVLVVVRGRLEGRSIVRREPFATLAALARRWRELLGRRRRHGYVVTTRVLGGPP